MASTVKREMLADERPLAEYAGLTAIFSIVFAGFVAGARHRIPASVGFADMARIGLASYKVGRLVAKDEVTSFIRAPVTKGEESGEEEPKPRGPARAIGELITCPYCVGLWVAAGFSYALVLFPRQTRLATTIFGAQAIADFLNAGFVKAKPD